MSHVGRKKAAALAEVFERRFPHLVFEYRDQKAEEVLAKEPAFIEEADVVVIALGDDTLALRLNQVFVQRLACVHVWLEPLGLGGHVLTMPIRAGKDESREKVAGCFRCLFEEDIKYGLINRSALAAAGQDFQRSLAGCVDTFTPFSALDAARASLEAAAAVGRLITRVDQGSELVTWRGEGSYFERANYRLSRRAECVGPGERIRELSFARPDCPDCADRLQGRTLGSKDSQ
jgi:hypothetical protein